ncbi:hypothetical protein CVT24_001546 [Panaeolus cyanescens]|uniref:Carboxylic ester hydrolase n=1 Tax=Panaeolus cyanescens TaxID=181874 RepID=A0A409W315_9AGAR|nr:hypothetical protein CVT24_001546 [Panaeolus cyanescens]
MAVFLKFLYLLTALLQSAHFVATTQVRAELFSPSADACASLQTTLRLENTTVLLAQHITSGSTISTPGSCQSSAPVSSNVCRVLAVTNTTSSSAVHWEMWLPDQWFGRFLAVGNGGLGGCIDYSNIDYGSSLHFATIGTDNGHDGNSGSVFLNHPEVINDFAFRAIHVSAVLGKQLAQFYYKSKTQKSYYLGCSTGGRQGVQSALRFPDDFDGIVGGAPATDWNHLMGWSGMLSHDVGQPNGPPAESIPTNLWPVITAEIMRQCDGLDGVLDQTITEPDECIFRPESLLCSTSNPPSPANSSTCLTPTQVQTLKNVYSPLFGDEGQLLYPRYDPGAEADGNFVFLLGPSFFPFTNDWLRFTIFNDSTHNFQNFSRADIEFSDTINPGGISTWNGDLSLFRNRGGKFITYHGRRDQLIASGNSKRMYDLISDTMQLPTLDSFYRLFLVPGMNHCFGGPGASAFGQAGIASNAVNDTRHNVLLAMVDWVEKGRAPDTIIGTTIGPASNATHRVHCRYPMKSVLVGREFLCQA